MHNNSFIVVEFIIWSLAAIFQISAWTIRFLEELKIDKKEQIQVWFESIWTTIEETNWNKLPEKVGL